MRVAIFIDGKNFYTGWRDSGRSAQLDFNKLTSWLVEQVGGSSMIAAHYYTGFESDENALDDTRGKLQGFLRILEQQRGFQVHAFPRKPHTMQCPHCKDSIRYTQEKEVDTTVVADMVFLGCQDAFDVAILLSGDTDYVPAVRILNRLGKQVYIASWQGTGVSQQLRNIAYDHINLVQGLGSFSRDGGTGVSELAAPEPNSGPATGSGPEAFLEELENAERKFNGGYVGLGYFLSKWKSAVLTQLPDQRREILDQLLAEGKVEVYTAPDGKDAIRLAHTDDASY